MILESASILSTKRSILKNEASFMLLHNNRIYPHFLNQPHYLTHFILETNLLSRGQAVQKAEKKRAGSIFPTWFFAYFFIKEKVGEDCQAIYPMVYPTPTMPIYVGLRLNEVCYTTFSSIHFYTWIDRYTVKLEQALLLLLLYSKVVWKGEICPHCWKLTTGIMDISQICP